VTQLVVNELVADALKYAPGPVLMDLGMDGDVVHVAVWDSEAGSSWPTHRNGQVLTRASRRI
jgi:hypothetical protein